MDTAVVIRSAVVKDRTAYVRAGAGIVYDSDPVAEANETKRKASAPARRAGRNWSRGMSPKNQNVLIIDNLDSFTFNLVEAFERLGCEVQVLRNTAPAETGAGDRAGETGALIVLSPGPGQPKDAGCCPKLIAIAKGRAPLLGRLPRPPGDRRTGRRPRRPLARAGAWQGGVSSPMTAPVR